MSDDISTQSPPTSKTEPMSFGMKCMYGFIVMLWLAAGAAVYVTFFSDEARQQRAADAEQDADAPDIQPAIQEDDEEQKTIVFNAEGEVVDPEENELPRKLEPFSLVNQSEEEVTLETLKGKPWVGTFVFSSCPGPCSSITGRMKQLQQDLEGVDFNLVSITVDPKNDDPEKLTKYADAFTADLSNWHFLTGDMYVIYKLIRSDFKMPVGEIKPGDILHTNRFVVVDAEGNYVDSFRAREDAEYSKLKKRIKGLASAAEDGGESTESQDDKDEPTEEKES